MAVSEYTSKELFEIPIENLLVYLNKLCKVEIPAKIETTDEMEEASRILARLGPLYSFLTNMEMTANVKKRLCKKDKDKKEAADDALTREIIFKSFADQVKMLYATVSRMLSVKAQINQELKMLGSQI